MLAFAWGTFFAAIGGVSAVGVAVFTGLAYRYGLRTHRADRKRYELKVLLGEHMDELTARLLYENTFAEFTAWVQRLQRLIDASLGRSEEQWVLAPLPGGEGVTETFEQRQAILRAIHQRLHELTARMDTILIREDFDPSEWRS